MKQFTYPHFTLSDKLSKEQADFFDEYGFIHFKNFISKETAKSFIEATEQVQKKLLDEHVEKINGIPIKFGFDENGNKIIHRFTFTSLYSPILHDFLQDSRFKAIYPLLQAEGRIGENEKDGLVVNHYVNTDTSHFTKMGWHTDSLRDVFYGKKIGPMLNVGVHLDDCPVENGGLRLIPGTHKQGLRKLLFRKRYFVDNTPDANEIGVNIEAGDLTVHDGRLWHRVALSPHKGAASRRRVMYVPIISGKYEPKDENSSTPFYHHFVKYFK